MHNWAKKDMNFDHAVFKQSSEWLRYVPDDLSSKLLQRSHLFSVDENSVVYDLDEELSGLYALVKGIVAIRTDTPQTEMICAHLMGPGAWFGEISAMTRGASAIGVEARTPCTLLVVPTGALRKLGTTHSDLWRCLAILAALNAKTALRVAREAMIKDPRERLLAVLDRLASELGFDAHMPLTQEQLSEICHLSLRSCSTLLGQLAREGRVACGYRSVMLLSQSTQ